ncbi:MAG TPA: hypothetical protein VHC21_04270 [Candidatus Saccharimonadales bacterium]|nr:hypothetical protein [Candidatus Saccharimonadales bacterium]
MIEHFDTYEKSFEDAQVMFEGRLDMADRSQAVFPASGRESVEFMVDNGQEAVDFAVDNGDEDNKFFPVTIDTQYLRDDTSKLFVNRVLLMHNPRLGVLSPVIITKDPDHAGEFQITMLNQPYDTKVGFSKGMHFGVSVKAQTRVEGFGGHGQAGGFEQGHFSGVILGGGDAKIAHNLVKSGDAATHDLLAGALPGTPQKTGGISETMAAKGMLDIPEPITQPLPSDVLLQTYWHHKLEGEAGPVGGDYPDATKLMLGAGVQALGSVGLERARLLVDDAVRGAV